VRLILCCALCGGAVAGCGGGGGSATADSNVGDLVQAAFLSALTNATSGNGTTSYLDTFSIYDCPDQNTGVALDQATASDLQDQQGSMLFHCAVTMNVSSNSALAPGGSEGLLYYLQVSTGGKWDAKEQFLPITSQDVIPPCSGALCNEQVGNSPPSEVAGDENSGHVVGASSASSTTAAGTGTSPAGTSGSGATTPAGTSSATGQTGTASTGSGGTIPSSSVSDIGPSPCGYLPETSKARGINYMRGVGVSCATVRKVTVDSGFCGASLSCSVDGYSCKVGTAEGGVDSTGTCMNPQGDKVIYNTAGSP
jgi:hypothetical protein